MSFTKKQTKHRPESVGDLIRSELSRIIRRKMDDPRLQFVTITEVLLTPDLKKATVCVSILGEEENAEISLKILQSARGFLRSSLGKSLKLRFTPEINFTLDKTLRSGAKIDAILKKCYEEE